MPRSPVVDGYLEEVEVELDAVEKLLELPPNRLASFHLQQAAEKLTKARRLSQGRDATVEHRISILLDGSDRVDALEESDPWRDLLRPLDDLSQFATTYRYPTSGGRSKSGWTPDQIRLRVGELRELLERARNEWT